MPRKSNLPVKHKSAVPSVVVQPPRPSLGQTLKEGIAFGVGQGIAHRAIGILLGGTAPTEHIKTTETPEKPEYLQCLRESKNNQDACKQFL